MVSATEFEAWVHARAPQLLRRAYLLTGDRQLAEDLLQDTLARVAQRWTRLHQHGAPDAYAARVLYHLSIDRWRRRRARPTEVPAPAPERTGGDDAEDAVRRVVLPEALLLLTPRQRAVLVLRFFEDRTEVESAELLGCSVSTVKSQTRHALARLRELAPDLLDLTPEVTR